jgi:hypothetical protein
MRHGVHRQIEAAGHACGVVAPSLIPRRAGDRVKTDRRNAIGLAGLHRAGELTAIWCGHGHRRCCLNGRWPRWSRPCKPCAAWRWSTMAPR